ncbi:MAG: chlorite dismutase family protein [Candidatus Riflebacteria bacterium]|nr:chlorite dismutase family protein [Candidatus Riflebacteria bacterium]
MTTDPKPPAQPDAAATTQARPGHREAELKLAGFAQFLFFKLDLAWHRLEPSLKEEGTRQFVQTVEETTAGIDTRVYSTVGFRPEVDFFLWNRAQSLPELQQFTVRLMHTGLGRYLHTPYLYTSLYRESPYPKLKEHEPPQLVEPKFLFVYPFVKTRPWYTLPMEERKRAMMEHVAVGHRFERVAINTSYSFGLGDQEFVIAFDTDYPEDFEALVRRLRETEASKYTLRDTPIFMGSRGPIRDVLRMVV